MNIGWNMRREHLRPEQRSHYVIPDGGDQPNVVPSVATVWYFIREQDFENIRKNFEIANTISEAAAKMTDTTVTRQVIGTAAPRHFNKPIAEAAYANIQQVGLPQVDDGRAGLRQGRPADRQGQGGRPRSRIEEARAARGRSRRAAAPTTSATSPGRCRRSR